VWDIVLGEERGQGKLLPFPPSSPLLPLLCATLVAYGEVQLASYLTVVLSVHQVGSKTPLYAGVI